jgi:hypothetical protein
MIVAYFYESGYNNASSILICVPIWSMIVALREPTIIASHPAMAKTSSLFVKEFGHILLP